MTSKVYVALRVPVDAVAAFDAFTRDISIWWRPDELFRLTSDGDGSLSFEPGVNGRLLTTLPNGRVFEIGRILAWEPGHRLLFTWRHDSFTPDLSTEVEVRFEAVGQETRVSVEHRAWDTIPRQHVARHGFPDAATLNHVSAWWRGSMTAYARRFTIASASRNTSSLGS